MAWFDHALDALLTSFGITISLHDNEGGDLNNLNTGAQVGAAGTSFLAASLGSPALAGLVAVPTALLSFSTSATVVAKDLQDKHFAAAEADLFDVLGASYQIVGDVLVAGGSSGLGIKATLVGAFFQAPALLIKHHKGVAAIIDKAYSSDIDNAYRSAQALVAFINSDKSLQASNIGKYLDAVEQTLSNDFSIFSRLSYSTGKATIQAADRAISATEQAIKLLVTAAGDAHSTSNDTVVGHGHAYSISAADSNSMATSSGGFSTTNTPGQVTYNSTSQADGITVTETGNVFIDGSSNNTIQAVHSDGSTVYSESVSTTASGGVTLSLSGQGAPPVYYNDATITVASNSSAEIHGSGNSITAADNDTVTVDDNAAHVALTTDDTLTFGDPVDFTGTIHGFVSGDTIDLAGIGTAKSATLGSNNLLTVTEAGGQTLSLQLDPADKFTGKTFSVKADSNGGTDVTLSSALYVVSSETIAAIPANAHFGVTSSGQYFGSVENPLNRQFTDFTYGPSIGFESFAAGSPPSVISLNGVNDSGTAVGSVGGPTYVGGPGFMDYFTESGGTFADFLSYYGNPPYGAPLGISDAGVIVGNATGGQAYTAQVAPLAKSATFVTFSAPGATTTTIVGITPNGAIYGNATDSTGTHGFTDVGGTFTTISDPNRPGASTEIAGMNDQGLVAGFTFTDVSLKDAVGFVDTKGNYVDLSASSFVNSDGTPYTGSTPFAFGVNDQNQLYLGATGNTITLATPINHMLAL